MKNKSKLISFALILFFVGSLGVSAARAADTPEQTAKNFYGWYLKELNREGGDPIKQKKTLSMYVTSRLIKQINKQIAAEEYDADYFIDAQDFDKNWQATTSKAVVKGNTATLKVKLAAPNAKKTDWTQTLSLKLIKEGGAWKIDNVKGSSK